MVHVVCLKWGHKYSPDYVNKLFGMVSRNLSLPFKFYCLTEDSSGIVPDVTILPLPELGLRGWWYKLYLFNNDFYGLSGTMLFLDLDVVITGSLDDLVTYEPDAFCIAPDRVPSRYNSSIMRFRIGTLGFIWDNFIFQKDAVMACLHGDQDWIQRLILTAKTYPYPWVVSYKYQCNARTKHSGGIVGRLLRSHGMFLPRKQALYPHGARVVLFHGKPDPEDVADRPYDKYRHAPWIKDFWKA
jgi:hypothetical protein